MAAVEDFIPLEVIAAQDMMLNWAANSTDSWEKVRFVKRYANMLTTEEASRASLACLHVKRVKRMKQKKEAESKTERTSAQPNYSDEDNLDEIVTIDDSEDTTVSAITGVAQPVVSDNNPWWKTWEDDDWKHVIALDVEGVQKKQAESTSGTPSDEAATISVMNFFEKQQKEWIIYHEKDSFICNFVTEQINGFKPDSLVKGRPQDEVLKEVAAFLKNKLIILVAAGGDFDKLKLKAMDYRYFDLQNHWFSTSITENGGISREPHGLASIYRHYFPDSNFQTGVHTSMTDAKATIRIFREIYLKIKTKDRHTKTNDEPFDEITRFVPEWKKKMKEYKKTKKFRFSSC